MIRHSYLLVSFDKKAGQTRTGILENQEFTTELHKPITKRFQRHQGYSPHQDKISGADLAGIQLHDYGIEIYLAHNEGKPVFAERLIRTLKIKIL